MFTNFVHTDRQLIDGIILHCFCAFIVVHLTVIYMNSA